jgi:hypothetical protein
MGWSMLWGLSIIAMLLLYPTVPGWLVVFSLAYVVYYHALGLYVQFGPPSRAAA